GGGAYQIKLPTVSSGQAGFQTQIMPSISVTSGSKTATITGLPNTYQVGQTFILGLTQTAGITSIPAGNYPISAILSGTSFQITLPTPALGNGSTQFNGGTTYQIYSPNGSGGSIGPPALLY